MLLTFQVDLAPAEFMMKSLELLVTTSFLPSNCNSQSMSSMCMLWAQLGKEVSLLIS